MKEKRHTERPLLLPVINHPHSREYKEIDNTLNENPVIFDLVHMDLTRDVKDEKSGAKGMTAEQVLKADIIKQTGDLPHRDLIFHIIDSSTYRRFCCTGFADEGFTSSTLCTNIKKISPDTWEMINCIATQ